MSGSRHRKEAAQREDDSTRENHSSHKSSSVSAIVAGDQYFAISK